MIIEQLSLFYHLSCFVCARCGIQLSDGQNETSVRIRNGLIYCYICYHRLSKSQSRSKERWERSRLRKGSAQSERHPSLARSPAKEGTSTHTSPCQSSKYGPNKTFYLLTAQIIRHASDTQNNYHVNYPFYWEHMKNSTNGRTAIHCPPH